MTVDSNRVATIVRDVAAAEIMPRFRRLESHQIQEKSPGNLVTEADTEAERILSRHFLDLLPGSSVVGEEAVAASHGILGRLSEPGMVWVIDPVDGTKNFAHERPVFGVIVALVRNGETVMGWIHDPVADTMAITEHGAGAWLDGRRLHVGGQRPLGEQVGSLGYRKNKSLTGKIKGLVRNGSVAHDYVALADGRLDFAYYRKLMPWDHAAGVLMHREAGGYQALLDGAPYSPNVRTPGLLLAAGEASWRELLPYVAEEP